MHQSIVDRTNNIITFGLNYPTTIEGTETNKSKISMETLNLTSCCLKDVQLSGRFFKFLVSSLSRIIFLIEQLASLYRPVSASASQQSAKGARVFLGAIPQTIKGTIAEPELNSSALLTGTIFFCHNSGWMSCWLQVFKVI